MAHRSSNAVWRGDLKTGKGQIKLGSGAFQGDYSFPSRFENGEGTNPEELIAAAHAGCFSMALAAALTQAGQFRPGGRWICHQQDRAQHRGYRARNRGPGLQDHRHPGEGELPGLQGTEDRRDHPLGDIALREPITSVA